MSTLLSPARLEFTIAQYRAMGEHGILPPDQRVELIDGEIIRMAPIGPPHAGILNRLLHALGRLCRDRAIISPQHPLEIDDYNEPQPDLCVLRWRNSFYADRHPLPADVLLLIEISDTTLRYDRSTKLALYARAGVQCCWIVNVADQAIAVFTEPTAEGYRREVRLRPGERIALGAPGSGLDDITIDAAEVFGTR